MSINFFKNKIFMDILKKTKIKLTNIYYKQTKI